MQTPPVIEIVSATRLPEAGFWKDAPLGISLRRLAADRRLVPRVAFANRRGLPELYNARIEASEADVLVFMHDDVWIDDYHLANRVTAGLRNFDVIGVAGNRRRVPGQPSWAFLDTRWTPDEGHLSGAMAHHRQPFGPITWFGEVPAACELLDGVFLAARTTVLRARGLRFDPRFAFHFYDMDLCRSARALGLRLGTWPICLTHGSGGSFVSPAWNDGYRAYLEKWGA